MAKIINVGVNDREIDLFEGQYVVPNGMAYNSYLVLDEKIALLDTVDGNFGEEWINNVKSNLDGKAVDYLIIQHMEPDHSACVKLFASQFPDAKIVVNAKTSAMLKQFFRDFDFNLQTVVDGEELSLGTSTLKFTFTPMVHWPEVMMTYCPQEKCLFSADAFGKFGTTDCDEPWLDEARRYYIGIVGKYGAQVTAALKKLGGLAIDTIYSLHGPVLTGDLSEVLGKYNIWANYMPETDGVLIAYSSIYGNTLDAVVELANRLEGKIEFKVMDVARTDFAEAIANCFKYSKIVFASVTYNGGIFPCMNFLLDGLVERNFKNRKIGFIENGSWAPMAAKVMKEKLANQKGIEFIEKQVKIVSSISKENLIEIDELADDLLK